jgi:hypothetical protein
MSSVIAYAQPHTIYGIVCSSLPFCGADGKCVKSFVVSVSRDKPYTLCINRSGVYSSPDGKYTSVLLNINCTCHVCHNTRSIINNTSNIYMSGYERISTELVETSIITEDRMYFCCSDKCKGIMEISPNLYV